MDVPKPAEASFAIVSMKLLPAGLIGLMVVAMLSATMSSMDSGLNRNAAIFTRDILPACARLLGFDFDADKPRLRLAQGASLCFGLIIIALTLYFANQDGQGVFEIMLDIGSMLALPLAVPMALAIVVRRAPAWSALVFIGVAFAASAAGFYSGTVLGPDTPATAWLRDTMPFYSPALFDGEWSFPTVVFTNVAAGALGFLFTMPFWPTAPARYRDKVDRFFGTMHQKVDFAAEVGPGNDASQLRIVGWFAFIIGGFVIALVLIPNPWSGRVAILFVGGCVAAAGGGFLWAAARLERSEADRAGRDILDPPAGAA